MYHISSQSSCVAVYEMSGMCFNQECSINSLLEEINNNVQGDHFYLEMVKHHQLPNQHSCIITLIYYIILTYDYLQ